MKFKDNIPIYVQIMEEIKKDMITGKLKEKDKIPSIRNYCTIYGVTNLTMQRVISELEREGIIITQKGIGSFIATNVLVKLEKDTSDTVVRQFIQKMYDLQYTNEEIIHMIKEELKNGRTS